MSTATYNVRLRRNRQAYADVMAEDPVLLYGEAIFVYDVDEYSGDRMKIGNGRDPFSKLPWWEDVSKVQKSQIGQPGGLVPLNPGGVVPESMIPDDLRKPIDPPSVESVAYTGKPQAPSIYVDDLQGQILTGDLVGTEVGDYMLAAKPAQGFKWTDGSTDTVFLPWSIERSN